MPPLQTVGRTEGTNFIGRSPYHVGRAFTPAGVNVIGCYPPGKEHLILEIVFSDSAAGSLKLAQGYGKGGYISGCHSVIITHSDGSEPTQQEIDAEIRRLEEEERRNWESATPLGGDPSDVFGLGLGWNIGDIADDAPGGPAREKALKTLYGIFPDMDKAELQNWQQNTAASLAAVLRRAAEGEELRLWYSDSPDESCGFHWLLARLQTLERCGPLTAVKLPEVEEGPDGALIQKNGWGDVAPQEWHRYLPLEKPLSPAHCRFYAARWRELQAENAPLRVVLNGCLVSMDADCYDGFIRREFAALPDEFQEAQLVGRVLGRYQLGIGDAWVALRVEEMLQNGELHPLTAAPPDCPIYHRMLKKG